MDEAALTTRMARRSRVRTGAANQHCGGASLKRV